MSQIIPFNYGDNLIRVVNDETTGEPLWVAKDICKVLGMDNHRQALSRLDDDEKDGVILNDSMGREQKATAVNESGLYSLILSSRKPEAKPFKRWVTHEVLPSIRKTGSYSMNQNHSADLTPIYAIMEVQTRILETMQVQNAVSLNVMHQITQTMEHIEWSIRNLKMGMILIEREIIPGMKNVGASSGFPSPRLSSEQRAMLYEAVINRAADLCTPYGIKNDIVAGAIFSSLKNRFTKQHYSDIAAHNFDDAIEFVNTYEISR